MSERASLECLNFCAISPQVRSIVRTMIRSGPVHQLIKLLRKEKGDPLLRVPFFSKRNGGLLLLFYFLNFIYFLEVDVCDLFVCSSACAFSASIACAFLALGVHLL